MGLHERIIQEKAWQIGPGIQDGADVEQAILGRASLPNKDLEYIPYKEAMNVLEEGGVQPNMLERSRTINILRKIVADKCLNKNVPVKFFTAVGSQLDMYHGVDAFFKQGNRYVTIDVSMRHKEQIKADVFFQVGLNEDGKVDVSKNEIQRVSSEIARRLNLH